MARSVLRGCRDVGSGLLLTMSCALLLAVLAALLDVAWLLVVKVSGVSRVGTSRVETVGLSWRTPLETVTIDRSPFWVVILDRDKPAATCVSFRRFLVSSSSWAPTALLF